MAIKRQSLAQLFREIREIQAQVALLRLDLQASRMLPKTKIDIGCIVCGADHGHGGLPCPEMTPMCSTSKIKGVE